MTREPCSAAGRLSLDNCPNNMISYPYCIKLGSFSLFNLEQARLLHKERKSRIYCFIYGAHERENGDQDVITSVSMRKEFHMKYK